MSSITEICHKIGWKDWCVPYGGIENPYRIVESTEDGARPCEKFMGEIFELSTDLRNLTKILNKIMQNSTRITYEIKFYMTQDEYVCDLIIDHHIFGPENHVFSSSVNSCFEDALYLSIGKLCEQDWLIKNKQS